MTKTTVEMLDLYARVRAIEQAGQDETWEVDGGRRREYFDLQVELHRLLGRQIWEAPVRSAVSTDQRQCHAKSLRAPQALALAQLSAVAPEQFLH